jgi:hypothetical protein
MKGWDYMTEQQYEFRLKLKYDYATWANVILKNQYDHAHWKGYLFSFMFNHISGPIEHKYTVMEDAIERTYATLARHVVHDARSKSQRRKLPILYAFPDYPTHQAFTYDLKDVTINDGLHYHGIMLIRTDTKMQTDLKTYFKENKKHFVKEGGPIRRIHIKPIKTRPLETASYALKSMEWRIPDSNRMLILPKALSELPEKRKPHSDDTHYAMR